MVYGEAQSLNTDLESLKIFPKSRVSSLAKNPGSANGRTDEKTLFYTKYFIETFYFIKHM